MWVSVLSVLFLLICPLLIFVVLVQDAKGGGIAGVLGGAGSGSAFGAKTADVVMKVTIGLGVLFFLLSIGMSFAVRSGGETASIKEPAPVDVPAGLPAAAPAEAPAASAPATPAAPAPAEPAPATAPSAPADSAPASAPAPAGSNG